MAAAKDLGPLDWRTPIVDKDGRPSPEFQRRWNTQRNNNGLIGSVTIGRGAPTGTPTDGQQYVDVSTTPYTGYVGSGGAWGRVGVSKFTQLSDAPGAYTGAGGQLVQVNSGATGLQFATISSVLDSFSSAQGGVLYRGATAWAALGAGTTGQVLQSGGASSDPAWITPVWQSSVAKNLVYCGPSSGASASPSFRSLVAADLPLATASTVGAVKPDGTTLAVDGTGTLTVIGGGGSSNLVLGSGVPASSAAAGTIYSRTDATGVYQAETTVISGSGSPALDTTFGVNHWNYSTGSAFSQATTAKAGAANEKFVVFVVYESTTGAPSISSVSESTSTLSFSRVATTTNSTSGAHNVTIEVWDASATSTFNSGAAAVTWNINWTSAIDDAAICIAAYSGVTSLSAAWDTNASLPAHAANATNTTPPAVTFSTSNADDLLLFVSGCSSNAASATPSGWTQAAQFINSGGSNYASIGLYSKSVTATQTSATVADASTSLQVSWTGLVVALAGGSVTTTTWTEMLPESGGALSGPLLINLPGGSVPAVPGISAWPLVFYGNGGVSGGNVLGLVSLGQTGLPVLAMYNAHGGTASSPTATQNGDLIGVINFGGYNSGSASWPLGAEILVSATANWTTSGSNPAAVDFTVNAYGKSLSLTRGSVLIGNRTSPVALSAGATDGFLYIPSCAGQPTGTPTSFSPLCPLVYDTTNHKLWVYDAVASAWKGVVLS